ncbi:hypothetical protein RB653_001413 [Dictyostelium firmibasis]|uniref:Ribosomal protein L9 domain-containing protein n=1 Tax=Dictyostelium firmibasis TaxID=79012 RepID=A0AAN7U523_9MYCE
MFSSLCKNGNKTFLSFTSSLLRNTESKLNYSTALKKKSTVQIILTEEIPNVGQKGEELEVSKGYARNFFFMKGVAVHANHENRKLFEDDSKKIDYSKRKEVKQSSKAIKKIKSDGKILVMRQVPPSGEPEEITQENISYSLKRRRNIIIEPKNILLENPITSFGEHNITLVFGSDIQVPATLIYNSL